MSIGQESQTPAADDAQRLDAALRDIDWAVLPAGAVASVFEAPSGELAMVSLGDPSHPRVVLVPGATGSKEDFTLLAPVLATAGYFVQSLDLAGQYQSAQAGPATGGRYDYDLFIADLVAFLRAGAPAHLLGYSFAGLVAAQIAERYPQLCRSLALLTTPPLAGQSFRGVRWIGWLSRFTTARVGASLMIWGIVTNKNRVSPGRLEFVRARFALTRRESVDDMVGLMRRVPDLRATLAASSFPRLVAVGSHDLWPTWQHARFARDIGAHFAVYRTGHSPCETAPHQLGRDLLRLYTEAETQPWSESAAALG